MVVGQGAMGRAANVGVALSRVLLLLGLAGMADCAGQSTDNGPDCAKLCEKGMKECPELPRADCDSQCLFEDARAGETGCRKQYDAVAACSSKLEDICTTVTACDPELDAFWACVTPYCQAHPRSEVCPRVTEDG